MFKYSYSPFILLLNGRPIQFLDSHLYYNKNENYNFIIKQKIIIYLFFIISTFISPGGLVTAVCPVVIKGKGLWVGWSGLHLSDPNEPIPESDPNDQTPTAGLKSKQVSYNWYFFYRHFKRVIDLGKTQRSFLVSRFKLKNY